jgi:hypothetical protein
MLLASNMCSEASNSSKIQGIKSLHKPFWSIPAEGTFDGGAYIESQGSLSIFGRSQYPLAYAWSIVVGMDLNVIPSIF